MQLLYKDNLHNILCRQISFCIPHSCCRQQMRTYFRLQMKTLTKKIVCQLNDEQDNE